MNSRMNFGNGFSIPQENDIQNRGQWMPLTPEKPIASRSSSIPVERQGNQIEGNQLGRENWTELMGFYTGVLQETTDFNGLVLNSNPIGLDGFSGGSYSSDFNQNVAWNNNTLAEVLRMKNAFSVASANGMPSEKIRVTGRQTIPNLQSQVDSNWAYSNYHNCPTNSNRWINGESLSYMPKDGFPVPSRPNYNLNSPPRSEADATSSVTTSFPFAPVTPDQVKQFKNHPYSEKPSLSVDESSSQEKDKLEDIITYVGSESIGIHCDELLQSIVDSSSVAISTPSKEKNNSDHGGNQGIDLNKTPQQKPPKRRKHRPKVVVEGKPKRAPKSTTPKNTGSTENPSGKRKYVRKNGLKTSETRQPNAVNDFTAPNTESAAKSCRRVLNFDLGNETRHGSPEKAEMQEKNRVDFNLNLDPQSMGLCSQINGDSKIISPYTEDKQQAGTTCTVNISQNQMPVQCVSNSNQMHMSNAAPIGVNMRTSIPYRSSGNNGYIQGNDQRVFQTTTSCESREVMWQSTAQLIARNLVNCDEKRGSKREYSHTPVQTHSHTEDLIGCLENHKRKKSETGYHVTMGGTPVTLYVEDSSRQGSNRSGSGIYKNGHTSQINRRTLDSHFQGGGTSKELNTWVNGNSQKQVGSSELQLHSDSHQAAEKRSRGSTQVYNLTSQTATTNLNQLSSNVPNRAHTIASHHANTSAKKQATNKVLLLEHKEAFHGYEQSSVTDRGPREKKKNLVRIDVLIKQMDDLKINGGSNEIVGKDQKALVPYKGDGIIVEYKGLDHIKKRKPRPKVDLDPETNRIWNLLMGKEGNEGIEAEDKEKWWEEERKVFRGRADSFIARMHLVQGDRRFSQWKGSVVDSVIGVFLTQNVSDHLSSSAFMSLAARFPPSTTTQKTHYQTGNSILVEEPEVQTLEANAAINYHGKIIMQQEHSLTSLGLSEHRKDNPTPEAEGTSLASENNRRTNEVISSQYSFGHFPLQPNRESRSFLGSNSEGEYPTSGHRPENICVPTPKNLHHAQKTTSFQEFYSHTIGSSLLAGRSKNGSEDTEYYNKISRLEKVDNPRGSSMFSYPSNSRIPQMQIPNAPSTDFQLHITPNSGIFGVDGLGLLGEQSIASLPQSASGIAKFNDVDHISSNTGQSYSYALLSKNPTRQESGMRPVPYSTKDQLFINAHQQESSRTFQLETTLAKEPTKPSEAMARIQTGPTHQVPNVPNLTGSTIHVRETIPTPDKWKSLENKAVEANAKEQVSSSVEAFSGISPNVANGKKGKAEGEKGKSIDWDSLRRNVQLNGRTKQRSKDTLDSLDYEAVRCAEVNEISAAIKERGMNNMLAERIKDFLNRLVREHGSIDLEWLRDAPPDKVKDYLLSVRGLGLKSVECVRLLTLHHLAFPVDTNVGRIAVRLGWVPLQPLPESLQLHLLEMYPMLESIQKYLWPRLCKLDQRTLYELHYQMITFGKVFCTKSKPNCNACPMRGECRHFASAFASARLALPGPEDRSIVNSSIPIASNKNHTVMIKPMPLPPPDSNTPKESGLMARPCEPIVEEPTTPELESIEVTASDIEEAYYEDADEIPTIKLNIEEFTMNLHNYMQENMELQEGDMSKALVALNQEVASIPAPKLKNVSRLRTEHQVYELPDSHPLLKGLDQREPDDPSPYLLAIWTPGETANSIQPPERSCGSQESGKFCGEKTCFSCNSIRESNAQTVRGTILIPCRTAMRGSFPLNGTYFQVNEMFADHESSLNPIDVPRAWIWNLPRRTVYFGTSVTSIFKGLSTEGIQYCFWRGFVCVRGFDQKLRAPRPLMARLHFPASKLAKTRNEDK